MRGVWQAIDGWRIRLGCRELGLRGWKWEVKGRELRGGVVRLRRDRRAEFVRGSKAV